MISEEKLEFLGMIVGIFIICQIFSVPILMLALISGSLKLNLIFEPSWKLLLIGLMLLLDCFILILIEQIKD